MPTAPTTTSIPATITVPQAADLMGVSIRSAYRMVEHDLLPVLRTGRRIRIITAKLYGMLGLDPAVHPVPGHSSSE